MLQPLIQLAIRHPQLVADHLEAYAELVCRDAGLWRRQLRHRVLFTIISAVCLCSAIVLAGVAIMLGVVAGTYHWALIVVPAVPLAIALILTGIDRIPSDRSALASVKAQIVADLSLLREIM